MDKSLTPFKKLLASQLLGRTLRFKCDCIISMDVEGKIKDYDVVDNEIVFTVDVNGKLIKIGENHPNLYSTLIS